MARRFSSAAPLALAYAALIVYATLYPFTGWRPVATSSPLEWFWLPWPAWWSQFDVLANLVGYMPLGALCVAAWVRSGGSMRAALMAAVLLGAGLSFCLETLQNFLPRRVPSRADWVLNSSGAALGAALAAAAWRRGLVERWQVAREKWLRPRSAGAIALLLLWPVALLFPPPVPFALGSGWSELGADVVEWLSDTALAPHLSIEAPHLLEPGAGPGEGASPPPTAARVGLMVMLGFLAPCLVALSAARPGWRRLTLPIGALVLGVAATTLSTAVSFGPTHALAWQAGIVPVALGAAVLLALVLCALPSAVATGVGLLVIGAQIALVSQAPTDPYYAQSLQQWEQGRFIRFHGAGRWIGWAWPYLAIAWLLARIGGRGVTETP